MAEVLDGPGAIAEVSTSVTEPVAVSLFSGIKLAPNPNKGVFTIMGSFSSSKDEPITFEITNMLGQVVYKEISAAGDGVINQQISLNSVANGMYILYLSSGGEHKTIRFVIE